jgi:hypothetical protein
MAERSRVEAHVMRYAAIGLTALLALAVLYFALAGNGVKITRQEYGQRWPFTVEDGILACRDTGVTVGATKMKEVTFTANGVTYAVNGTAKGNKAYANIDGIWAEDPERPGLKKDIQPIIDMGLQLCD